MLKARIKPIIVVVICIFLLFVFIDPLYYGISSIKNVFKEKEVIKPKVCKYIEDNSLWYEKHRVITHALGGIDGKTYTNSIDALEENYNSGKRMFETDLSLSSDNVLILNHDYDETSDNLVVWPDGYIPSLEEFNTNIIDFKYKPTDALELIEFMSSHSDMLLTLDVKYYQDISEVNNIMTSFVNLAKDNGYESILRRVIPMFYTEDNYNALKSIYPFRDYIYALYAEKNKDFESVKNFCLNNNIKNVLISYKWVKDETTLSIFNTNEINVYVFTLNKLSAVYERMDLGVYGFVSDYMYEDDLKLKPVLVQ